MIVCVCHGVSDRTLRSLIGDGVSNLREIGRCCNAGTDCGACLLDIRQMAQQRHDSRDATDTQAVR